MRRIERHGNPRLLRLLNRGPHRGGCRRSRGPRRGGEACLQLPGKLSRRPREKVSIRIDGNPNRLVNELELVILERLELDHDPNDIGSELRVAHIDDATAVGAVVQDTRGVQAGPLDVDDQPRRVVQREIRDIDGTGDVDDHQCLARTGQHTDGRNVPFVRRGLCDRRSCQQGQRGQNP